jgi:hypothetical protein
MIADVEMWRALNEQGKKGVNIRVIGVVRRKSRHLKVRRLRGFLLHTRTIVRDRREAFVGSQSLRKAELDSRREVGVIVRDSKVVKGLVNTFEADWAAKGAAQAAQATKKQIKKRLKKVVTKLSPLNPIVKKAVEDVVDRKGSAGLNTKDVKETVEKAVKEAVRERVQEMLNESAEQ